MMDLPNDFTPDLRRLKSWPSMEGSPWRQPYLADLTYGEIHRLVDEFLIGGRLKVLEIGCGTGFLSLELAREGHSVLAVDSDSRMIDLAKQTMQADPYSTERGALEYELADFTTWHPPTRDYDVVVVSRVLHHIRPVEKAIDKAARLVKKNGQIIVIDVAYDMFDSKAAAWLFQLRRSLRQAGWLKPESDTTPEHGEAVRETLNNWVREYEKEDCNRFDEIRKPLRGHFKEEYFSWEPYLYWEILGDLTIPSNDAELAAARFISSLEKTLIETGEIPSVFFCFVGCKTGP